ncbi:MAG: type II secretion system protein [Candidatus Levybacteria bacterium]|nr:type II secretion system protein [Candidatus Levybacteria bacterium]
MKSRKSRLSSKSRKLSSIFGFTLIELLIVIAIIGVLSALLMVNFIGIRQRARDAQRKANLRQIQSALELYRADIGSYPESSSAKLPVNCPQGASTYLGSSDCSSTYVQKIPTDLMGASYYNSGNYYYSSSGTTYTLAACLENSSDKDSEVTNTNPDASVSPACTTVYYVLQNP